MELTQSIETYPEDRHYYREFAIAEGLEQKEDKQILRQLVEDERSIKEWKARFGRYAKLPPIEGDLIAGMRKG